MAAVVQDITAEQGAALAVTFTGAGASLQGRTLRMHVRSKVGVTTTKLVASTTDGRLAVGANPYTTATLAIDADIMAAVSITLPTEYWVYDVESYTTAADVRREWSGRFTITRDVTRDTEATTETALSGAVLYSGPQSLTTAQKLQARDNIGAGTGSGGGSIDDGDKGDITVSASGATWTIDANAVTFAKMQAVSANVLLGNDATGAAVEEIACTAAGRALLDDATAADQRTTLGLGTAATTAATAYEASGAVSTHNAVTTAHGTSAFGATLVDDADAATARTTLGLGTAATSASGDFAAASHAHAASAITSGTLVHERGGLEADVSAYSGLVKITAGATSAVTVTAAGEALLDDADASAQRATLGLGGAAVLAVGTTAGTVAAGDDSRLTDDRTASGLRSATTVVSVSASTAPSSGQVLTATSSTAATWQTPSGGSSNTKWVGAGELIPRVTNGAGIDGEELATNDINLDYLAFDSATSEGAQVSFAWPSGFTTFTAQFHWTAASGSGTVTWTAAARCYADDDALDQAQGTAQSVTDTLLAANDAHKSSATSAVTPGGTVASGNLTVVQIARDIADTLAVDARLIGVMLEFA